MAIVAAPMRASGAGCRVHGRLPNRATAIARGLRRTIVSPEANRFGRNRAQRKEGDTGDTSDTGDAGIDRPDRSIRSCRIHMTHVAGTANNCIVWRSPGHQPRRFVTPMQNADEIWRLVEAKQQRFSELSDRVWHTPETNYQEHRSCAEHVVMLEREGFRVTRGAAGLPTAVMGEFGEGGPVVAILGEYDALPGLSQEAGVAEKRPLAEGGNGHGCGHNLLG